MAEFVKVGRVEDFAENDMKVFKLPSAGDVAVLQQGGRFYAFSNICTHNGVNLAGTDAYGDLEGRRLTCMLHDSSFDIRSGRVTGGPAYDRLPTYEVKVEDDEVLVGDA